MKSSPNLVMNFAIHQIWWIIWWQIWWFTKFCDKFDDLLIIFFCHQICHLICHQMHQRNYHSNCWPTKFGDENVTKIITTFGESSNKVKYMSPNSLPNLVITKFVIKHLGLIYADRARGVGTRDTYVSKNIFPFDPVIACQRTLQRQCGKNKNALELCKSILLTSSST